MIPPPPLGADSFEEAPNTIESSGKEEAGKTNSEGD
jgi:hypothetical protein